MWDRCSVGGGVLGEWSESEGISMWDRCSVGGGC